MFRFLIITGAAVVTGNEDDETLAGDLKATAARRAALRKKDAGTPDASEFSIGEAKGALAANLRCRTWTSRLSFLHRALRVLPLERAGGI